MKTKESSSDLERLEDSEMKDDVVQADPIQGGVGQWFHIDGELAGD
jgi:hypothetical protein